MELLYLGIGIVVLAGLLIYSLAKRSAGWLRWAQIAFYAVVIVVSSIVYYDAYQLNRNFFTSDNTILLREDGQLYAGIRGKVAQAPAAMDAVGLAQSQDRISQGELAEVRGGSYKLFVFDVGAFWDLQQVIRFGDVTLTRDDAVTVMRAADPVEAFADIVVREKSPADPAVAKSAIRKRFASAEELKAKLFSAMIAEATQEQGKAFVPLSYRSKTLVVDPRTPYFLFIQYAPQFLMDLVIQRG